MTRLSIAQAGQEPGRAAFPVAGRVAGSTRPGMTRCFVALAFALCLGAQDWPKYAGDAASTHYSPLDQITPANAGKLKEIWEWRTGEEPLAEFKTTPGMFEATPLEIGNTLYLSTPYNVVVALNAETGKETWRYDPKAYAEGQVPNGTGFVHRGVAAWEDGRSGKLHIFMNSRYRLISLDAATGKPDTGFGDNGVVDLAANMRWPVNPKNFTSTSPPVVYKDLVIVGDGVADKQAYPRDTPGDVRAYNAHTGKLVWTFHTVPMAGEFGVETWGNGSEKFTGHTNVWAPMSLDEARGLLYLPVSTPSNDFYGGARPGENLFADSLVCLDAVHGKAQVASANGAPRAVGLRHAGSAAPGDDSSRREESGCGGAVDQAGMGAGVRPGDREAGLADRRATGGGERCAGREVVADAAVPDQAACLREAGRLP